MVIESAGPADWERRSAEERVAAKEKLARLDASWRGALDALRDVVPDPCDEYLEGTIDWHDNAVVYRRVRPEDGLVAYMAISMYTKAARELMDALGTAGLVWEPVGPRRLVATVPESFRAWAEKERRPELIGSHLPVLEWKHWRSHYSGGSELFHRALPRDLVFSLLDEADRAPRLCRYGFVHGDATLELSDADRGFRFQALCERGYGSWPHFSGLGLEQGRRFHESLGKLLGIAALPAVAVLAQFGEWEKLSQKAR